MASIIDGFACDIFISYRQKDNKGDRWVTQFVQALRNELDATLKEEVSIYFDENPHDGLLESHHVDKSLEGKLRCAIFIPIISQTYCDPKSFAWQSEFCAFNHIARTDAFGMDVKLHNGNVSSRVLPVRIHDVDATDRNLFEKEAGSVLRSIDFIYKSPGVNRPLTPLDKKEENLNRVQYRDQVNKVANAVKEILSGMADPATGPVSGDSARPPRLGLQRKSLWTTANERDLGRVGLVYVIFALVVYRLLGDLSARGLVSSSWMPILLTFLALGFPLALILAWQFEFSPSGIIRTDSTAVGSNPFTSSQKRPFTGTLALLVLVVLLAAQMVFVSGSRNEKTKSIAVLYFDNLSNDPEQEFFTAGITDEISAHLSRIPSLQVTSRTSVLPYKGKSKALNIRKIADELGVDNILDGSVQKSGNKLHITAQLIEVKTDKSLWSETFDREVTEVFSIQSDIARAIAGKFSVAISPEVNARLKEVPTKNMEAYDLFLKARSLPGVSGFGIGTSYASVERGIVLMKQAIKLDQDFADAYLLLAGFYWEMGKKDSALVLAKEGVLASPLSADGYSLLSQLTGEMKWLRRTLALDTAAGLKEMGWALWSAGDKASSLRCFMEARKRTPNDVGLLVDMATCYNWMGIVDSVQHYIRLAKRIDPRSREVLEMQVMSSRFTNDLEAWKAAAVPYYGDDSLGYYKDLGVVYLFARKWKEAEAAYARTNYRDIDLGLVLLKTGREDSGRQVLRQSLIYHNTHPGGWLGNVARLHAVLGNRKEALEYYQKVQSDKFYTNFFKVDPFTDYIRDDPEYKKLEEEAQSKVKAIIETIKENSRKPFSISEVLEIIE